MNRDSQSADGLLDDFVSKGMGSILGAARHQVIPPTRDASEQFAKTAKASADVSVDFGRDPMAILSRTYELLCTIELATGSLAVRIGDGRSVEDERADGFPDGLSSLARALNDKAQQIEANVARCDSAIG